MSVEINDVSRVYRGSLGYGYIFEVEPTHSYESYINTKTEIRDWCRDQFGGEKVFERKTNGELCLDQMSRWNWSGNHFYFRSASDATAFKIRWM